MIHANKDSPEKTVQMNAQIKLHIIVRVFIGTACMISMITHLMARFILIFTAQKTTVSHVFYLIHVKFCTFNLRKTL